MMDLRNNAFAVGAGLMLCCHAVAFGRADLVTQSSVGDGRGLVSEDTPGSFFSVRTADEFVLTQDSWLTGMVWLGFSESFVDQDDLQNASGFTVRVYEASASDGLPGPILMQETLPVTQTSPVFTGVRGLSGGKEFRHQVTFGAPVPLAANTVYWVSVGVNLIVLEDDSWLWSRSLQGNQQCARDQLLDETGFVLINTGTDRDVAFTLIGSSGSPACRADINGDQVVNTGDLTLVLVAFGGTVPVGTGADLSGDGAVNTTDLTQLLVQFGSTCPAN